VKDGSLPADEQILDVASVKVLEKVYDHAPPWGRGAVRASANCGAAVRAGSSVATHRLCTATTRRAASDLPPYLHRFADWSGTFLRLPVNLRARYRRSS